MASFLGSLSPGREREPGNEEEERARERDGKEGRESLGTRRKEEQGRESKEGRESLGTRRKEEQGSEGLGTRRKKEQGSEGLGTRRKKEQVRERARKGVRAWERGGRKSKEGREGLGRKSKGERAWERGGRKSKGGNEEEERAREGTRLSFIPSLMCSISVRCTRCSASSAITVSRLQRQPANASRSLLTSLLLLLYIPLSASGGL